MFLNAEIAINRQIIVENKNRLTRAVKERFHMHLHFMETFNDKNLDMRPWTGMT